MSPPKWTETMDATLTRITQMGGTAKEVANELGVSRNAVIGRARRRGIPLNPPKGQRNKYLDKANHEKIALHSALAKDGIRTRPEAPTIIRRYNPRNLPLEPILPPVRAAGAPGEGISFAALKWGLHCRYPLWGTEAKSLDEKLYCGNGIYPGKNYCPYHLSIMWQRPWSPERPLPPQKLPQIPRNQ